MRGHRGKGEGAVYEPESGTSPDTVSVLILNFLAFRTLEINF
jgi:hypothetical protein